MAVSVEMQHTGDPTQQREVASVIEHVLADRPGDWRVSIVGSQANDRWEMKIVGPNAFERSYTLEGSADEHRPEAIRVILGRMLPLEEGMIEDRNYAWLYWCRGLCIKTMLCSAVASSRIPLATPFCTEVEYAPLRIFLSRLQEALL
jgi:hypothetical protein